MTPTLVVRIGQQMLDVLDEDDFFAHLDVWWDEEAQTWGSGTTPLWTLSTKVAAALNRMKAQPGGGKTPAQSPPPGDDEYGLAKDYEQMADQLPPGWKL